jgi:hypothetical protein
MDHIKNLLLNEEQMEECSFKHHVHGIFYTILYRLASFLAYFASFLATLLALFSAFLTAIFAYLFACLIYVFYSLVAYFQAFLVNHFLSILHNLEKI